jgi:hypothetical protein
VPQVHADLPAGRQGAQSLDWLYKPQRAQRMCYESAKSLLKFAVVSYFIRHSFSEGEMTNGHRINE